MLTLSNGLSFFRAPLAFLLLYESPLVRLIAIFLAMVTDSVDGYFARKNQSVSRFGAILDPTMDKFFVYFAISVLFFEQKILFIEMLAMLSRDFFLCMYGITQLVTGKWRTIHFRAIRWGKVTTALQFLVLMGLIVQVEFPWYLYAIFTVMGGFAFLELIQVPSRTSTI